jgi:hypothetical protein
LPLSFGIVAKPGLEFKQLQELHEKEREVVEGTGRGRVGGLPHR